MTEKDGLILYRKGKKLYDEGMQLLEQARSLRISSQVVLDDIEKLKEKFRRQEKEAGDLFVQGHALIEEGQKLLEESGNIDQNAMVQEIEE